MADKFILDLFGVQNKVVLVTGGGVGIGLMISTAFIRAGAKVYIASRKLKSIQPSADELNKIGPGSCIPVQCDASKLEGCKDLFAFIHAREPAIHVLVNNAGATWGAPLRDYPDEAWDKLMAINVKGVFHMTVQFLPLLKKAATKEDPARVINIGSINGLAPPAMETYAYSASKAAVHMLSKHLAVRLASDNITVNAIAAGPFPSQMMKATLDSFGDAIIQTTPLKRIGKMEDIGGTLLYLSSPAAAWVTGVVLPVDGGNSLRSAI